MECDRCLWVAREKLKDSSRTDLCNDGVLMECIWSAYAVYMEPLNECLFIAGQRTIGIRGSNLRVITCDSSSFAP
jgi:hypothetical protein